MWGILAEGAPAGKWQCSDLHPGRDRGRFRRSQMANEHDNSDRRGQMNVGEAVQCKPVEVVVGDKGVDRAVKHLKRKMASEGILRELKRRRHYMKPSVRRRKKEAEAARRRRKRQKQLETR